MCLGIIKKKPLRCLFNKVLFKYVILKLSRPFTRNLQIIDSSKA